MRRAKGYIDPSRIHELRVLAERGLTAPAIAIEMGSTTHLVLTAARQHGVSIRKMTPSERGRTARASVTRSLGTGWVTIPNWVPRDLHGEYRDQLVSMGAEWAARHVRRMMEDGDEQPPG
ncbi:hypothetical protein [Pararhodobacter sp.]|uniref:hypothetical protein n=1 Tax=Pararhodobacter sp. TaxID=2127056 RepID=UPI002AFECB20|nr:hypothetical protein [Pararhodobacter sp.]